MGVVCINLSAWSEIILVMAGWAWPIETVETPAIKSKYLFPLSSNKYWYFPSTINNGYL